MALNCFVVAPPGLEELCRTELRQIGLTPDPVEPGGVAFPATHEQLYRANLQLRVASRILVRVASFHAAHFSDLEKAAQQVDWGRWIASGSLIEFRVSSHKSRLYHQKAIAERLLGIMSRRVSGVSLAATDSAAAVAQRFVVRVVRDRFIISVDSSGGHLHQRGYRLESGKAPIRENLAAAMLLAAGWNPATPLIDPFAGSGTIPIEAAMIARRIPPGWFRGFGFENWPTFDPVIWNQVRDAAGQGIVSKASAPIVASDRDLGALRIITANADRAGVLADLEIITGTISDLLPPPEIGAVITNPPYGDRIGDKRKLLDLYARFGTVARSRLSGWKLGIISADQRLTGQMKLNLMESWQTNNGGIPIRFLQCQVPVNGG